VLFSNFFSHEATRRNTKQELDFLRDASCVFVGKIFIASLIRHPTTSQKFFENPQGGYK
jgi:hypothetical protein